VKILDGAAPRFGERSYLLHRQLQRCDASVPLQRHDIAAYHARVAATADARTPQQPQIGDEEIHRTCILLEGTSTGGRSADVWQT
jgi:hypothetical protein